jgi:predicted aspartyl protease
MISYNPRYDPPAPFLQILVANRFQRRKRATLSAMVDTGSDVTAIPSHLIKQLDLYATGKIYLEDVNQQTMPIYLYGTRLTIVNITFNDFEVITTELEHALIGRDLLNHFRIELDGRAQQFTVHTYD